MEVRAKDHHRSAGCFELDVGIGGDQVVHAMHTGEHLGLRFGEQVRRLTTTLSTLLTALGRLSSAHDGRLDRRLQRYTREWVSHQHNFTSMALGAV